MGFNHVCDIKHRSIQLLCTGILGQYLAKTYLESKHRPIYIIDSTNVERGNNNK